MITFNPIYNKCIAKKLLLTMPLTLLAAVGASATDISGRVTDAATGKPLAGVQVKAYGNPRFSAMTNTEGVYTIKEVPEYITSVYMTLDGAAPQQVAIGKNTDEVNAEMYSNAFSSSYTDKTNALRSSKASGFDNNVEVSIDPLIQQRLGADVRAVSRGGNDGMGNAMFIGGLNSISANAQPLIVVDGVIMDMKYDSSALHDGYFNNLLANINVNDIDKVEVLKNGTALYGAKGANGVIMITTKRNRSMATKIDVTIGGKYQLLPTTPDMMNASDYRTYATEMLSQQVSDISGMKMLVDDPTYYYYPMYHNNTDWKKEAYENAFAQQYGINVQGGDDVANYNLSVGYSLADSPLKRNDFSRFDMRLNTDIQILKNLNVRFDASFSDVNRNLRDLGTTENVDETSITSPSFLSLIKAPFLSPYAYDINGNLSSYLSIADDYLQNSIITNDRSLANPASILLYGEGRNCNTFGNRLVMFSVTPTYQFNKHLKLSEAFNFTLVNTNEEYYLPIEGMPGYRIPGTSERIYEDNIKKSLAARQNSIQSDTRLTWDNRYNAHAIELFTGVRYMNSAYKLNAQWGMNTGNDKTPNLSPALSHKQTQGVDDKYTDITWYASAAYNYAEKYYLTAILSAQASSRFGKEVDGLKAFGTVWGIFPSVQGSYVLTNEKWFPKTTGVNYLRVNAGFDVSGNDDINATASRSYFVSKNMLGTTINGIVLDNVGNSTLKWETTKKVNAGIEGNFVNNRIHATFNIYKSWTNNLLTLSQMAWTSGLKENWGNDGKLENKGFDFALSGKVINCNNWHWELGFSVGHYDNKVTALKTDNVITNIYGANIITKVGSPIGMFYGYRTNGVYASSAEAKSTANYYVDESGKQINFQAGDMKFIDQDGNHEINDNDRVVIGNPNPDIYGNIYSHLNWKKWTLDITFNYSLGNDIYNYERSILESGKYFFNQTTAMSRRWTTEGQVTDMPRISYQDPNGNSRFSDRWIEDGSYLRMSDVTLSYTLPINHTFLQGITVWGSAQNLFTITKYLGSNPDCTLSNNALAQGIDRGLLGKGRSFAMGVKINL